jgi:hypothetical protein
VTTPDRDKTGGERPLTPARTPRGRERRPGSAGAPDPGYDDAEVQRGLAAAVLGSLGRIQLRLDAIAREQTDTFAELREALAAIDRRLAALERSAPVTGGAASTQYAPRPFSTDTTVRASSTMSSPSDQSST